MDDKPEQAVESGEPSEVGRRHGQIIDKDGTPTGQEAAEKSRPRRSRPSDEVAPESGRHKWDV